MRTVTIVVLALAALVAHCQAGVYRGGYGGSGGGGYGGSGGSGGSGYGTADDYSSWAAWGRNHGDSGHHEHGQHGYGHHGHWDHGHWDHGSWRHDKQHTNDEKEEDTGDWKWHSSEDWHGGEETTTVQEETTTETTPEPTTTTTTTPPPPAILENDDQLIQMDNADVLVIETTTTEEPDEHDTTDKYDQSPLGHDDGGNSWSGLSHTLQAQPSAANTIFLASNLPGDLPLNSILSLTSNAHAESTSPAPQEPAEPATTIAAPREPAPVYENELLLNLLKTQTG